MKKHKSQEALYERMRNLAQVNKPSLKETQNRTLGTLIDTKKAANGVVYGIIKEQHKYYIKKGGLNENQNVADFAYIGGLSNITDYQYNKLSEAEKQLNMVLKNINEAHEFKINKNGSKISAKKVLTEDKASKEIDMAASKVDDLEAATDAAEVPAEPELEMPPAGEEGAEEMDAGIDAMPSDGGEGDLPPAEDGEEELPPAEDGEGDLPPAEDNEEGEEEDNSGTGNLDSDLVDKIGEIAHGIKSADINEQGLSWALGTFLSAFEPQGEDGEHKLRNLSDDKRHEYADKILRVTTDSEKEDLGQNVEDTAGTDEIAEEECSECGGFAQYAESRGYDADSIKECGEEEMTNLISGYANANGEGQNDGDFKAIALFITPEIIDKLKGEYGHEEFANQVEPFSTEMNEASAEDKDAQINELFGGLKNLAKDAGQGIKQGAQNVAKKVGDAATSVKQSYHTGELPKEVKKVEDFAAKLGQQIGSLNTRMEKAGKQPVNVQSILTTIKNQIAKGGAADLSQYANEEGLPVDHTEVQPNLDLEEDVDIKVSEKEGKKLSPDNTPEVEMKEGVEEKEDDLNIDDLNVDDDVKVDSEEEKVDSEEKEDDVLDLTKHEKPEMEMNSGFESIGGGVVKPESAESTTVEVTKDSVNVTMNETLNKIQETLNSIINETVEKDVEEGNKFTKKLAKTPKGGAFKIDGETEIDTSNYDANINESEKKLRKYIRNRLEEHAGIRKPSLNESKKSETIQKLDRVIDKQFKLFESKMKEKIKTKK